LSGWAEDGAGYSLDFARFDQYAFNSDSPEAFTSGVLGGGLPRLSEIVGLVPPRLPTLFTAMSDVAQGFILQFHPNMFFVHSLDCFRVQSNCNEKREY
jgi:hypothetical protein